MKSKSKATFWIVFAITIALLFVAIYGIHIGSFNLKGANEMRFGIDIRGGVAATYTPKDLNGTPTADQLEKAMTSRHCSDTCFFANHKPIDRAKGHASYDAWPFLSYAGSFLRKSPALDFLLALRLHFHP